MTKFEADLIFKFRLQNEDYKTIANRLSKKQALYQPIAAAMG